MIELDTVVLPVAGQGTRMLPATKAVPKELLPVYDTPLLQFALDEAVAAGARRIVLVSHPEKKALERYFDSTSALEADLRTAGKTEQLSALSRTRVPADVEIRFVYQNEPLGLGHAVLCARDEVRGERFGVILPDDLILEGTALGDMRRHFLEGQVTSLVAAMKVPRSHVSRYGIFRTTGTEGAIVPCDGLVEKPSPERAPSQLAAIGRYILPTEIFAALGDTSPGAGGEIQLTDAIDRLGGVHAFPVSGSRYDCGSKDGLFDATVALRQIAEGYVTPERVAAE